MVGIYDSKSNIEVWHGLNLLFHIFFALVYSILASASLVKYLSNDGLLHLANDMLLVQCQWF